MESNLLHASEEGGEKSESERYFVVVDVPSNTASAALISFTVCKCCYTHAQNGLYRMLAVKRLSVRVGEEVNDCLLNYVLSVHCCDDSCDRGGVPQAGQRGGGVEEGGAKAARRGCVVQGTTVQHDEFCGSGVEEE